MNSKLLLVAIVALIAVFAGFIFLGNKNANTPSRSSSMQSEASVTPAAMETNGKVINVILGDSGFVPKDITVDVGTTVVWINKSGKSATVNSDDHPTHSLYPFLNLGEFPNSLTLEVVFEKKGKYSYHDHYNATSIGTVTVE